MVQLEDFIKQYELALASQNWTNVAPLMHEEVQVTFSTGAVYIGINNVKNAFVRNFSLIKNEKYIISNIYWIKKTPLIAIYSFEFAWTGIVNNEKKCGEGQGYATLIKEDDKWLLLNETLMK